MILKNIKVSNFRNYDSLDIILNKKINIIYGNNGQGKTNLLESIYVLAFTKSHRSFIDSALIKKGKESALIKGTIFGNLSYDLEILINKTTKKIKMDGKNISKIGDYIEKMNIITFYSDDLDLIKGSPNERRKYLNLELSQISKTYYNTISDYNRLLKTRNNYLKKIKDLTEFDSHYFSILTDYIVEKSVFIYQMREKYVKKLNENCGNIYKSITKNKGFNIKYIKSGISNLDNIRKELKKNLTENLEKEISLKSTLYGPHLDDFEFYLEDSNLKNYGSQGQQRIAVIALKLAEIEIFKNYKKTNPIILLDDVFSELDINKKNNLLDYIDKEMQVIITTTDLNNIDKKIIKEAMLINIEKGKIIEVK